VGRSSGAGPGRGAIAAAWSAASATPRRTGRDSSRANPASTAWSAQSNRGRATWRWSTATSCRNTSSFASLVAERRRQQHQPSQQLAEGQIEQS
jgi:hypothetical protein